MSRFRRRNWCQDIRMILPDPFTRVDLTPLEKLFPSSNDALHSRSHGSTTTSNAADNGNSTRELTWK